MRRTTEFEEKMRAKEKFLLPPLGLALLCLCPLLAGAEDKSVSYFKDVVPVLKRSCYGCHNPNKAKGKLDMSTYAGFLKGGKERPGFVPGDTAKSHVLEQISGDKPAMPDEGEPLTKIEVALVERWIREGARDDSPPPLPKETAPAVYPAPPIVSALAYSPDGDFLAVSGYYEILLHHADGSGLAARLAGESPRLEAFAFSPDGKLLAACGGMPTQYGEIQIWDVAARKLFRAHKVASDSLFGISFSPDGQAVAVGGADKAVRVIAIEDGKELMRFDGHTDWVFGTTFTRDGKRLVTASRDKAMKLLNLANGQFVDDVNKNLESALCLARHPKQEMLAYGGALGVARLYRISDNQQRGTGNTARDANLLREFERQSGAVHALAFSPDGSLLAVGSTGGEVRLYRTSDGSRAATLSGIDGAVFALAFHPAKNQISVGGYDGKVRLYETDSGKLLAAFVPVPLKGGEKLADAAK